MPQFFEIVEQSGHTAISADIYIYGVMPHQSFDEHTYHGASEKRHERFWAFISFLDKSGAETSGENNVVHDVLRN